MRLDSSCEDMDETLTVEKVAEFVSNADSIQGLQRQLVTSQSQDWLVCFLELVRDAGVTSLLDTHTLLPSQAGGLLRRAEVRRDKDISDELKDIAEAFELPIRKELLDKDAELNGLADLLPELSELELLRRLLLRVKDVCKDKVITPRLAPCVVRLFLWMAKQSRYIDLLEGFPVPTLEEREGWVVVLQLERGREMQSKPLVPVAAWPEGAREFGSLFPKRRVLAEALADAPPEVWSRLAEKGFVNLSPRIVMRSVVGGFLPDAPLPEQDGAARHKSTEEVEVSDIAFLRDLIDVARNSRRNAKKFLRFLAAYVAGAETRDFEVSEVECECGERHRSYRAAWLTPLHDRRWVPPRAKGVADCRLRRSQLQIYWRTRRRSQPSFPKPRAVSCWTP